MRKLFAVVLLLALAPSGTARASNSIDLIEHIFGATNIHAVTGHGGMSVGVSAAGDVTVLTWPSPSYVDQLAYMSSNAVDAREMPRFGASEGAGMFLGLVLEHDTGERTVTWLRDRDTWSIEQDYGPMDGVNVHTRYRSDSLGMSLRVIDAVHPDDSVFARRVHVERDAASTVTSAWLLTYANLSPLPPNAHVPEIPALDWALDGRNDYAAVWDAGSDAVLHFHPEDRRVASDVGGLLSFLGNSFEWGPVGEQMKRGAPSAAELSSLVSSIDDDYAEGTYLALSTVPAPDQHHIGADATPFCDDADEFLDNLNELPGKFDDFDFPVDPELLEGFRCDRDAESVAEREGWSHAPEDAYADAADGELSGSGLAADEVNEALRTPIDLDGDSTVTVVLSAGATAGAARSALTAHTPSAVADAASSALDELLADVRLPEESSAEVRAVARRALINIRVAMDEETGAIVSSISRQPPYGLDWPRDAAFYNPLLDVSGQSDLVDRRVATYAQWQRKEPVEPTPLVDPDPPPRPDGSDPGTYPAGAWEMNYYADGTPGGTFRFEIDNTAFSVWTMIAHVGWTEQQPEEYLRRYWDTIVLATDLLAGWRDPENGLHFPAQEDDHPQYEQSLHGAVTVFGALDIATRAARFLGEDEKASEWEMRAAELRDAILAHLYDEEAQRFVKEPGAEWSEEQRSLTSTAWLVWPAKLLPWDDPRVDAQLRADLEAIAPVIELDTEGGQYFMKNTVSLALARNQDPDIRPRLDSLFETIARDHPTEGTRHFGECMVVLDEGGDKTVSQRVSVPHTWEATLFYLTAMAIEDPSAFRRYDDVLPPSQVPEPPAASDGSGGGGGGGCRVPAGGSSGYASGAAVLVVLALALGVAARRGRGRRR